MSQGLLDTSVFIALESDRPVATERLPEESLVSVVTVAELELGVLAAPDTPTRARRLRAAQGALALTALAIDGPVAEAWARLSAALQEAGRRMAMNDLWIASVAVAHAVPVVTQDDDFDVLVELGLLEVVKV